MIVADKKVLEANLAKGTLSIQYKLNILYRENLNSLSTQSALIAIVGLVGFQQGNDYDTPTTSATIFVSLLLFLGLNIGTIASFIAYTLSSVEVIWGPIMGLSGDHHSEVIEATRHMLIQQNEAMLWLVIGVFAIISTPYFYVLLLVDWKCSIPVGIAVLVGYYVIWTQGMSAYNLFNHDAAWKGKIYKSFPKLISLVISTTGLDNALYQEYQEDKSAKSKSPLNTKAAIAAATTLFSGSVATLAQKEEEREHWFKEQIDKTTEANPTIFTKLTSMILLSSFFSLCSELKNLLPEVCYGSNPSNYYPPPRWLKPAIVSERCL